jgi:hypothetical protein
MRYTRVHSRREFLCTCCGGAACVVAFLTAARAAGTDTETRRKVRPDTYCGLYCGACPNALQSRVAKDAKDVKCLGCRSEAAAPWCGKCEIKECAKTRNLESCGLCGEYPCAKLKPFHFNGKDYRLLAAANCDRIKQAGYETWLKEQKKRWRCPKCEARFSWSDEKCPACGADVDSCTDEAARIRAKAAP